MTGDCTKDKSTEECAEPFKNFEDLLHQLKVPEEEVDEKCEWDKREADRVIDLRRVTHQEVCRQGLLENLRL